MNPIFFHIDVNSAFLSWTSAENLKNGTGEDLRLLPSIIGGDIERRHGVVLAKSLPAKKFNIKTGEPIINAFRKCPHLVVAPPDHSLYKSYSDRLFSFLADICPDIEQLSIDECFMDFTPIAASYPSAQAAAAAIKDSVYEKFGFTVNIGVSDIKILAKMASDFQKPNLVHTLYHSEIKEKMWPMPVSELYMCGKSSIESLNKLGITTIGELANANPIILTSHLKSHGKLLWEYANGIDTSTISLIPSELKGIGNSITLSEDALTSEDAYLVLLHLAESVSGRLRSQERFAIMVSVEIKYNTFQTVSHQTTLETASNSTEKLYTTACRLFDEIWNSTPVRLLGIRTSKLITEVPPVQMNLFDIPAVYQKDAKQQRLEHAIDSIRQKFGEKAITRGSLMAKKDSFKKH